MAPRRSAAAATAQVSSHTLEDWCAELARAGCDLATSEMQFFVLVSAFEADHDAWAAWVGDFDDLVASRCGVHVARFRAFARAVSVIGMEDALILGVDAALALVRAKAPADRELLLYRAVGERIKYLIPRRPLVSVDKARAIVREECRRLHIGRELRPVLGGLPIAIGALERIASGKMDSTAAQMIAQEALDAIEGRRHGG